MEVEFQGDPHAALASLQYHELAHPDAEVDYHPVQGERQFAIKLDGSVDGGGELVSYPMDFDSEDDRRMLFRAVEALREADCATSPQAGIHVHVGNQGMDNDQELAVAKFFVGYEDAIYRQAASGWGTLRPHIGTYAHPFKTQHKAMLLATGFKDYRTLMEIAEDTRYFGINFASNHPTIEFRVFNSSLNPHRILSHMAFSVGVMRAARSGTLVRRSLSPTTTHLLGGMFEGWREEQSVFNSLMRVLRPELTDYDARLVAKYWKTSSPQQDRYANNHRVPGWFGENTKRQLKAKAGMSEQNICLTDDVPEGYEVPDILSHPHGRGPVISGQCCNNCGLYVCSCCTVCGTYAGRVPQPHYGQTGEPCFNRRNFQTRDLYPEEYVGQSNYDYADAI